MAFDTKAALAAGYSENEVYDYLKDKSPKFDYSGAEKAGYSKREIIDHVSGLGQSKTSIPAALPAQPSSIPPASATGTPDSLSRATGPAQLSETEIGYGTPRPESKPEPKPAVPAPAPIQAPTRQPVLPSSTAVHAQVAELPAASQQSPANVLDPRSPNFQQEQAKKLFNIKGRYDNQDAELRQAKPKPKVDVYAFLHGGKGNEAAPASQELHQGKWSTGEQLGYATDRFAQEILPFLPDKEKDISIKEGGIMPVADVAAGLGGFLATAMPQIKAAKSVLELGRFALSSSLVKDAAVGFTKNIAGKNAVGLTNKLKAVMPHKVAEAVTETLANVIGMAADHVEKNAKTYATGTPEEKKQALNELGNTLLSVPAYVGGGLVGKGMWKPVVGALTGAVIPTVQTIAEGNEPLSTENIVNALSMAAMGALGGRNQDRAERNEAILKKAGIGNDHPAFSEKPDFTAVVDKAPEVQNAVAEKRATKIYEKALKDGATDQTAEKAAEDEMLRYKSQALTHILDKAGIKEGHPLLSDNLSMPDLFALSPKIQKAVIYKRAENAYNKEIAAGHPESTATAMAELEFKHYEEQEKILGDQHAPDQVNFTTPKSKEELMAQYGADKPPEAEKAPEARIEKEPAEIAPTVKATGETTPKQPRGVKEQAPSPEGTVSGEQKAGEQATPPASTVSHETKPAPRAKVSAAIKNPDMPLDGFTDAQKEIIQKYREKRMPKADVAPKAEPSITKSKEEVGQKIADSYGVPYEYVKPANGKSGRHIFKLEGARVEIPDNLKKSSVEKILKSKGKGHYQKLDQMSWNRTTEAVDYLKGKGVPEEALQNFGEPGGPTPTDIEQEHGVKLPEPLKRAVDFYAKRLGSSMEETDREQRVKDLQEQIEQHPIKSKPQFKHDELKAMFPFRGTKSGKARLQSSHFQYSKNAAKGADTQREMLAESLRDSHPAIAQELDDMNDKDFIAWSIDQHDKYREMKKELESSKSAKPMFQREARIEKEPVKEAPPLKATEPEAKPEDLGTIPQHDGKAEEIGERIAIQDENLPAKDKTLNDMYRHLGNGNVDAGKLKLRKMGPGGQVAYKRNYAKKYGVRFQIEAYHGSPHDIDKFSSDKIGTGQGAQSFGHGLYFTNEREIAKHYAASLGRDAEKIGNLNTEETKLIPQDLRFTLADLNERGQKWGEGVLWRESQLRIESRTERAKESLAEMEAKVEELKKDEEVNFRNIEHYGDLIDYVKSSIKAMEKLHETPKENWAVTRRRKLYSVTLHKGKKPSEYDYLKWDKKLTGGQKKKILEQAKKEGFNIDLQEGKDLFEIEKLETKTGVWYKIKAWNGRRYADAVRTRGAAEKQLNALIRSYTEDGQSIYRTLAVKTGNDRAASDFLLRAGIDGIQYDAGTLSGTESKAKNYVVFDDKAISIESKEQFQKEKGKEDGKADENSPVPGASGTDRPTRERAQGTGKNEDSKKSLSKLQEAVEKRIGKKLPDNAFTVEKAATLEQWVAEQAARRFSGKKVIWFRQSAEGKKAFPMGGVWLRDGGEDAILMNVDTQKPHIVTAIHEAMHVMQAEHPDLYRDFVNALVKYGGAGIEKYARKFNEGRGYSEDELPDEAIAEISAEQFLDPKFLDRMADENPTMFRKFTEVMKDLVGKMQKWIGRDVEHGGKYLYDLHRVQGALAKAITRMEERVRTGEIKEGEAGERFQKQKSTAPVKINKDGSVSIGDFDAISDKGWGRISNYLKRKGYDYRGAEDAKNLFKRQEKKNTYTQDQADALKKVFKIGDYAPKEKTKDQILIAKAKRYFGVTNDMKMAGYITTDGKLLDLSGKKQGNTYADGRSLDHREIGMIDDNMRGGTAGMQEFMAIGNIRMDLNAGMMDMVAKPTAEQRKAIARFVYEARKDGVILDLEYGIGKLNESQDYYRNDEEPLKKDYDPGTPASVILKDIDAYYAGELKQNPESLTQKYHNSEERFQKEKKKEAQTETGNKGTFDPTKKDIRFQKETPDFEQFDLWGNAKKGSDLEEEAARKDENGKLARVGDKEALDPEAFFKDMGHGDIEAGKQGFKDSNRKTREWLIDNFNRREEARRLGAAKEEGKPKTTEDYTAGKKTKDLDVSDLPIFGGGGNLFDALFQKEGPTEEAKDLIKQAGYKPKEFDRDFEKHGLDEHGETKSEFLQRVLCGGKVKFSIRGGK